MKTQLIRTTQMRVRPISSRGRIAFPLVHPDHIAQSRNLDDFVALHEYRIKPLSLSKRLKSKLRRSPAADQKRKLNETEVF